MGKDSISSSVSGVTQLKLASNIGESGAKMYFKTDFSRIKKENKNK